MEKPHNILKKYWGYDTFRPLQLDIITAVLEQKDVLALMPTGGGKSICFQVPAMILDGLCIVITPLVALMRDQVEQLKARSIKAVSIHAGLSAREIDILLDNCAYDKEIKFLYLSPERIKSDLFIERLKKMKVCLLAIDEAHCIAQWGYDFRPSYLEITQLKKLIPNVPTIAVTATATKEAQGEIIENLNLKNLQVFAKSFHRPNLSYSCFEEENKIKKVLSVLDKIQGSSIIYVRSRKQTQELAAFLKKKNISAAAYHAGMSTHERNTIQDLWVKNTLRVIVATNAFGMGIDKPDVRSVIHIVPPESLEAYYQEAGRAGRDEKKAFAVLLYTQQEVEELKLKIEQKYPSAEVIKKVYQSLANFFKIAIGSSELASYDFNEDIFVRTYKLKKNETFYALKRLELEGFIQLNEGYHTPSKVYIPLDHTTLYDYQLTHPETDPVLKSLLRLYGGEIFSTFMAISEQKIAAQTELTTASVKKILKFLHASTIINYIESHAAPQITFTTPRLDAATLPLNQSFIQKRKNIELEKLHQLTTYCLQNRRCRSLYLQEYFGEISEKSCGICDVCLQQKNNTLDYPTFKDKVIKLLNENPKSAENLVQLLKPISTQDYKKYFDRMLDEGLLKMNQKGDIQLTKN